MNTNENNKFTKKMLHYLSKYKSPKLFTGCYSEIKLSDSKNFNEKTVGQLVGKSGERKEEFFSLTGVKPHIEYSDDKPILMLSKYNSREIKLAHLLGERFQTTKSWSSSSINKHVKQLQERLSREEGELGQKILSEYWPEKSQSDLAELVGGMSNERYSPTQTLLEHSIEVATEAKQIAEALSLDSQKLQRMALFHDIGKVVLPYYQHSTPKVLELIPELQSSPELTEAIVSHHNPLGSFSSPYLALIALINRIVSQSHFIVPEDSKIPESLKKSLNQLLTSKLSEKKITHFYILSSYCYFWFILRCPKANQEELTKQLSVKLGPLLQSYSSWEGKELKNLNFSLFWLPEEGSEDKISLTRLKLSNYVHNGDNEAFELNQ
ncbi:phosphohydrolase [Mycoplasma wenyonii]|uniref:Phosphohydrolase n=1 Tax=Mycoplasma wenyonii TaxID=65123 RepID=A0A328PVJ5_9MOLU|nr:phosphohydrolase [Mycoplasma wenyonii]